MRGNQSFFYLVLSGFLLAGPAAYATRTVSWFEAHPDVRDQVHRLCMDNPGEAMGTPDCLNASTAIEHSSMDGLISRIPVKSLAQVCADMPAYQRPFNHCGDGK